MSIILELFKYINLKTLTHFRKLMDDSKKLQWLSMTFCYWYMLYVSLEASITKLTFYHISCFLLSKDAFTPNLAEFGPVTSRELKFCGSAKSFKTGRNYWRFESFWIFDILRVQIFLNFQNRSTFTIQIADWTGHWTKFSQIWCECIFWQ